jgi:NAD(P)-dependent dehydrogenase (short-subunit alcohol dehydrogenase family)
MRIETGQVAVVTGGTSGIGFALAVALMQRGVNGVVNGVRTFAPLLIAQAATEAVEADRVHAIVDPGSEVVVRQRVDGLLADLV